MLKLAKRRVELRKKRALRVRKKVRGSAEKPRLCVNRTNRHIFAQLIDDDKGLTLASVSTVAKEFKETEHNKKCKASARKVGERLAEIGAERGVKTCVFDRGSHKFHGVVAELAEGARAGGLKF